MGLTTNQPDPLDVLESTRHVLENSQNASLHEETINNLAKGIEKRILEGLPNGDEAFGKIETIEEKAQFAFVVDSVNFCFWAEKGKTKWQTEWPKDNFVGGGFGLNASFQRAITSGVPILDPNYLSEITLDQTRELFRSSNEADIPLLKKRQENLQEAGRVLNNKYQGKFINLAEAANFDAVEVVKQMTKDFVSYNDTTIYNGRNVNFYKRAQLCVCDLSLFKDIKIANIDKLTAFADYKLPQILRENRVITYSESLAEKIDNYVLIPAGSPEEAEIRSATIWGVELIRQSLKKYTAAEIDNAIWYLSQDQTGFRPYHRTYTIYY